MPRKKKAPEALAPVEPPAPVVEAPAPVVEAPVLVVEAPPPVPLSAQELFVSAAERWAAEHERHGYSMLAAGMTAVAERGGWQKPTAHVSDITSVFHDPLVRYADAATHPDSINVTGVIRQVERQATGQLNYRPPGTEYGGYWRTARFGLRGGHSRWIPDEIEKKLRTDKIRRGSKKYATFVAENSEKVRQAVRDGFVAEQAALSREIEARVAELDAEEQKLRGASQTTIITDALLAGAGLSASPEYVASKQAHAEWIEAQAASIASEREQIRAALTPEAAEAAAAEFMRRDEHLRPFSGEPLAENPVEETEPEETQGTEPTAS